MALIDSIIKQIESLDYLVVERNEGETRVLIAEPTVSIDTVIDPSSPQPPPRFRQMVRVDGNDEESRYQAACQLALQCGIRLEEG